MTGDRVWLVLPDPFPTRVFVDCGIVQRLSGRLSGQLEAVLALSRDDAAEWAPRLGDVPWMLGADLFPADMGLSERVARRIDLAIDRNAGYYPLSVRHSLRNGFHRERMRPGHPNLFLDSSLTGRLPDSEHLDALMRRWLFSRRRYVSSALVQKMRSSVSAVVIANVQSLQAVPFLNAARRLGLPVVGYVASWDHTVGKGIVSPHLVSYVVQNDAMRDDLVGYHGIPEARITVTGWPQTDVFHRRRPREAYNAILTARGLDPSRPLVLVAGNTPTNAPYEGHFVDRLVAWSRGLPPNERPGTALSPPSTRPGVARALRRGGRCSGRRRAGALLHGHRRARHVAPARRLRGQQRGDDLARRACQRPSCRLRPLRRGCSARRAPRGAQRHRAPLRGAPRLGSVPASRRLRGGRRLDRAVPRCARRARRRAPPRGA